MDEHRASELAYNVSASVGSGLPLASFGDNSAAATATQLKVDNSNNASSAMRQSFFNLELRKKQPSIAM